MKTLRILFVTLLMSALLIGPAQGAGGEDSGFVPLLERIEPSVPLGAQAQEAFERLLPALRAGQARGALLDFQPLLGTGIVKVTFAAGARPATLLGHPVYADARAANEAMPRAFPAGRAGAEIYDPHFSMYLVYPDVAVNVSGLDPGDRVVASLRDRVGKILASGEESAGASRSLYLYFNGSYTAVLPGYRVTFKIYTAAGALRGTYAAVAPAISYTSLDTARSIARGTGPAGKAYSVSWYHANLDAGNTALRVTMQGTIPATKAWSADFGTRPFRRGDSLLFSVMQGTRFTFTNFMSVPYATCYLGEPYVGLYGFPNRAAAATVVHAGRSYSFAGRFSLIGWFSASVADATGMPVLLKAGDRVSGTGVGSYALPALTASIDFATDVVSGKAPAGKYILVMASRLADSGGYSAWIRANGAGTYSVDFSSVVDLDDSDAIIVSISYTDPASGNRTYLYQPFGP